jgi:hypothetical protein
MCGGSRFMWPLSDAMKKPSQGTTESWPERLLDPADLREAEQSPECLVAKQEPEQRTQAA